MYHSYNAGKPKEDEGKWVFIKYDSVIYHRESPKKGDFKKIKKLGTISLTSCPAQKMVMDPK